jgi:hypothetical protein
MVSSELRSAYLPLSISMMYPPSMAMFSFHSRFSDWWADFSGLNPYEKSSDF